MGFGVLVWRWATIVCGGRAGRFVFLFLFFEVSLFFERGGGQCWLKGGFEGW